MDHHRETGIGEIGFFLLTVAAGIVAGLGAVLFRALIGFIHNLLFLGQLSFTYDANVHTPPSPWGPLVILVPVVGAIAVSYLVKNFAPEAKGHGVPEVIDAIYYNRGIIRPIVAAIKSLASGLSIGSGGSVGREGPIIQIGASFGSSIGQILKLPEWQVITLIAAGAGGGIAATFNTPVGGILFAIELILVEVSMRTLVPVAIATAIASYIGRVAFGGYPSFVIPELQTLDFRPADPWSLLAFVGLGCVVGLVIDCLHPGDLRGGGFLRQAHRGQLLPQTPAGHAHHRYAAVRDDGCLRALLHRGRGLCHRAGHPVRRVRQLLERGIPAPAPGPEAARDRRSRWGRARRVAFSRPRSLSGPR